MFLHNFYEVASKDILKSKPATLKKEPKKKKQTQNITQLTMKTI